MRYEGSSQEQRGPCKGDVRGQHAATGCVAAQPGHLPCVAITLQLLLRVYTVDYHVYEQLVMMGRCCFMLLFTLPPTVCCSFGVVLWEMYTGRPPYPGMSHSQVLHCVSTGKVLTLPGDAPAAFAKLLASCLARSPADR